eukprot:TRINITY_DN25080_c0_g1_i2.p1 TRINITY_DN25080_c0_g1~~TRINITY_DN25080_c0_g1_i2.p1  ORF type:complete len:142 (-),score=34.45 TRINITY_DN25080_c0_g1_i2:140-508(-)
MCIRDRYREISDQDSNRTYNKLNDLIGQIFFFQAIRNHANYILPALAEQANLKQSVIKTTFFHEGTIPNQTQSQNKTQTQTQNNTKTQTQSTNKTTTQTSKNTSSAKTQSTTNQTQTLRKRL